MPFLDFGYWHTQPEYWISRSADAPKREDILFLTGYNNRLGNRGHYGLDKKCMNTTLGWYGVVLHEPMRWLRDHGATVPGVHD